MINYKKNSITGTIIDAIIVFLGTPVRFAYNPMIVATINTAKPCMFDSVIVIIIMKVITLLTIAS